MNKMTKDEVLDFISKDSGVAKITCNVVLAALSRLITIATGTDQAVPLTGLGSFQPVVHKARIGRNPRTGASINVPEKRSIKFKVSKSVKESAKVIPEV
jgi:nucleoid DNA-binding protein